MSLEYLSGLKAGAVDLNGHQRSAGDGGRLRGRVYRLGWENGSGRGTVHKSVRCAIVLASLAFASTSFAAAPSALYNKSVVAAWSESRGLKGVDNQTVHRVVSHSMGIYVSGAGRMFMPRATIGVSPSLP